VRLAEARKRASGRALSPPALFAALPGHLQELAHVGSQ
jgi:hypothetical protein